MKKGQSLKEVGNLDELLGARVRHVISGLTGIVKAFDKWLNGCVRLAVGPEKLQDGKVIESHWFDIQELEYMDDGIRPRLFGRQSTPALAGGPREAKSEPMAR